VGLTDRDDGVDSAALKRLLWKKPAALNCCNSTGVSEYTTNLLSYEIAYISSPTNYGGVMAHAALNTGELPEFPEFPKDFKGTSESTSILFPRGSNVCYPIFTYHGVHLHLLLETMTFRWSAKEGLAPVETQRLSQWVIT
jgi:hypothetical protein